MYDIRDRQLCQPRVDHRRPRGRHAEERCRLEQIGLQRHGMQCGDSGVADRDQADCERAGWGRLSWRRLLLQPAGRNQNVFCAGPTYERPKR